MKREMSFEKWIDQIRLILNKVDKQSAKVEGAKK